MKLTQPDQSADIHPIIVNQTKGERKTDNKMSQVTRYILGIIVQYP